ncbi:hypothetical protein SAY87_026503 [Trapa incisa]|uniref:Uncharacterized protein n=1 Tax=Trapa incisa TaxID=236973 RepID=A0AAN7H1D6_9MYRT|nr:hypothetical protein SAY87_026503 [Trapa incisa]
MKNKDKYLISKFFSPKQVKRKPELNQEESSHPESVETNFPDGEVIKEPKMEEFEDPSITECKPNLMELHEGSAEKSKVKPEYKEFAPTAEGEKHHRNPFKKKKAINSTNDKQSTLFSYFGKKHATPVPEPYGVAFPPPRPPPLATAASQKSWFGKEVYGDRIPNVFHKELCTL